MTKRKASKKEFKKEEKKPTTTAPAASVGNIPSTTPLLEACPMERKIFFWTAIAMGLIMVLLSFNVGINGDDEYQHDYSEKLVDYYTSFGNDNQLFKEDKKGNTTYNGKGNMHFYGGTFDLLAGGLNRVLGYDSYDDAYHTVRHIFNALFGFLCLLFTGLLAKEIAADKRGQYNWRAGIVALVFMFLSPRFLGHSLMNPKDIPFAAGTAMSLYFIIKLLKQLSPENPNNTWRNVVGFSLGAGLAISTRAGGILLIAYLGLFALMQLYTIRKDIDKQSITSYIKYLSAAILGAYFIGILFWPYALLNPIANVYEALTEFSNLGVKIRILYAGDTVMSNQTPWYYALDWIWRTIPLFVLIGFPASLMLAGKFGKKWTALPIVLMWFAVIFPVAYIIVKDSVLHDGWRHLLFIYPPMVVAATLFWVYLQEAFSGKKMQQYALYGMVGLMLLEPAIFIVKNLKYPYIYFNIASGGLSGNHGHYETDYWGLSLKEAVDWMDEEGIIGKDMQDTVQIATNFSYIIDHYTRKKYKGKVNVQYARYGRRNTRDYDYGVFNSRFVRAPNLQTHWPNSKAVWTEFSGDIPLSTILKEPEGHPAHQGEKAIARGDFEGALVFFKRETELHPDNELGWVGLSEAYYELMKFQEALNAAENATRVVPKNSYGLYHKGIALVNLGYVDAGEQAFLEALSINNEFYLAHYYLALIGMDRNQLDVSVKYLKEAIEINPRFVQAYALLAEIYTKAGQPEKAKRIMDAAEKIPKRK